MAFSLFGNRSKTISIEIKDYVIRFADVKHGKQPVLHRCGERALPQGIVKNGKIVDYDSLKMIMMQCIDEWKIARREVHFSLPDKSIFMRKIRVPLDIADNEIEGYIYLQLGTSIHVPFEDPFFDFYILGEIDGEKELLLFAAPEDMVMQYKNFLEDCKLKPIVADLSPLAIYRLYNAVEEVNNDASILSLYISLYDIDAAVFWEGKPQFIRNITIPVEQELWERTNQENGQQTWTFINEEEVYFQMFEDIYLEIERVLNFYKFNLNQGNKEVSQILISGDHPFLHRIIESFRSRYEMESKVIHEENIIADQPDIKVSSFYLPIGLALRGGK